MFTDPRGATGLITHLEGVTSTSLLVQSLYHQKIKLGAQVIGVVSPFSDHYEKPLRILLNCAQSLKLDYKLNTLILDISLSGDKELARLVKSNSFLRNEKGEFRFDDLGVSIIQLSECSKDLFQERSESFVINEIIQKNKVNFDLIFLLPSVKNSSLSTELDLSVDGQIMLVNKKLARKTQENSENVPHFHVPFFALGTFE